jgi:hypothetical protein
VTQNLVEVGQVLVILMPGKKGSGLHPAEKRTSGMAFHHKNSSGYGIY